MKKITTLLTFFILITSCAIKQGQNDLSSGDYDAAINIAISNLQNNNIEGKVKPDYIYLLEEAFAKANIKVKQDYIYLLEKAFAKAKERDLNNINFLKKENIPSRFQKILNTYVLLNERQEKIKPLLPLTLIKEGRNAVFLFDNYDDQIINSKNDLCDYLYTHAKDLLLTGNKKDYRKAYDDLIYLSTMNPDYKDSAKIIEEAKFKGTDFVMIYFKNETDITIPTDLQNDLLNFNTNELNDKWTVFHRTQQEEINYNYALQINLKSISISPEQVTEQDFKKVRDVNDGEKFRLDWDKLVTYKDKIVRVKIKIHETRQLKSCQIAATVNQTDFKSNRLLESFPLTGEFIFENIYATYAGDLRAADDNYSYFNNTSVPFPTNEKIMEDAGKVLKVKIKDLINANSFKQL